MISQDEYRALREAAAIVDRSGRGRLLLVGADRRSYLQGLLTNDISALTPGTGCYAAYLTAQGRMIADMRVFEMGDAILLDVEGFVAAKVRDRLSQFIFSEDVEIRDLSEPTAQLGVYGPESAAVVAKSLAVAHAPGEQTPAVLTLESMPMLSCARWDFRGSPVYVMRSDDVGVPGFDLVVDRAHAADLVTLLRGHGAIGVDDAVVETTRIEAGRPRFGADMTDDTIPLEAGIEERAISRTKGCYVGQEIIIRVLDRGHGRVARRLVGLKLAGDMVPAGGDAIHSGEREIGRVTSAAYSPLLEMPIALGYVHRDFTEPGTSVHVAGHPATVVDTPFV